jgi:hypothetical protein
MTKITSHQSDSGRNIIRFIILQRMTSKISDTERSELEKKYKGALVRKNAADKIKKTQDPKELPAYENIAKAIYSFMKNKRGPAERTFEEMIDTSPMSAQHN